MFDWVLNTPLEYLRHSLEIILKKQKTDALEVIFSLINYLSWYRSVVVLIHLMLMLFQIEARRLICSENQWNGFYMMLAVHLNGLKNFSDHIHAKKF